MDHPNYGLRMLRTAVLPVPARVAVMVTGFCPPPSCPVRVVTVKVAVLCPAATVTVCGTRAFRVSLLVNVTARPPAGAQSRLLHLRQQTTTGRVVWRA